MATSSVLYLDVDDEITSAASRIRAATATRLAIVIPPGSRIATSRINFRLLAREAIERNRRLAIVAPDAASRALAASAGLPVFSTVGEFEDSLTDGPSSGSSGDGMGGVVSRSRVVPPETEPERAADSPARDELEPFEETTVSAGGFGAVGAAASGAAAAGSSAGVARTQHAHPIDQPGPYESDDWRPPITARSAGASIPVVGGRRLLPAVDRTRLGILGAIVALAIIVLAVSAYLLLPSATIAITPRVDTLGPLDVPVTADPDATTVDAAAGVIPAQRITIPLSTTDTFPATGRRIRETKATGAVTFQNCDTGRRHSIPAGSIVGTGSGILFVTSVDVSLDRASTIPFACKAGDTGIKALKPGPNWNVGAGAINRIPAGFDPVVISVTNQAPTTGGTHTEIAKVSQKDVDAAITALTSRLDEQFQAELGDPSNVPAGATVFPDTRELGAAAPTSDPTALVDQEIESFQLTMTASGTVTAVDESPLQQLGQDRLRASVASEHTLVDGSIDVEIGTPVVDGHRVSFPLTVSGSQVREIDPAEVRSEVRGHSLAEARSLLSDYGDVRIDTWPGWVSSIPTLDFRLSITVDSAAATASPAPSGSSPSS